MGLAQLQLVNLKQRDTLDRLLDKYQRVGEYSGKASRDRE